MFWRSLCFVKVNSLKVETTRGRLATPLRRRKEGVALETGRTVSSGCVPPRLGTGWGTSAARDLGARPGRWSSLQLFEMHADVVGFATFILFWTQHPSPRPGCPTPSAHHGRVRIESQVCAVYRHGESQLSRDPWCPY